MAAAIARRCRRIRCSCSWRLRSSAFAFLGLGLVIAMLADNVPAVQALGQAIFLPMIMIGGVGVPLRQFKGSASWVPHVASFLPGKYAVEAFDGCVLDNGGDCGRRGSALVALFLIGLAAIFAGAQTVPVGRRPAAGPRGEGLGGVGISGLGGGRAGGGEDGAVDELVDRPPILATGTQRSTKGSATTNATIAVASTERYNPPATVASTGPATAAVSSAMPATTPAVPPGQAWKLVTDKELNEITYDDVPPDQGTVVPLAQNLDNLDDDGKKRIEGIQDKLADWKPAQDENIFQRVLNLLSVAAIADVAQDQYEAEIPYVIFDQLRRDVPEAELKKGGRVHHPAPGGGDGLHKRERASGSKGTWWKRACGNGRRCTRRSCCFDCSGRIRGSRKEAGSAEC